MSNSQHDNDVEQHDSTISPENRPAISESDLPDDDAPHLLVIDDDRRIRELIRQYLNESGFRVSLAADAASARKQLTGLDFDLLIVDVMMPGESGIELTRYINETFETPVLMLTALAETDHRIEGLAAGADDYLPKPFDPRELLLRINSILKRTTKPSEPTIEQLNFGSFQFSVKKRELMKNDKSVHLTDREQEIMIKFALSGGETVARQDLLKDGDDSERKIDVQINRLRQKIEDDPGEPKYLLTVRGIGYRLMLSRS